jgi:hypothetical protein
MKANKVTGRIKIIKVPAGEAPYRIRRAWVGLVLPCLSILGFNTERDRGVLSGKKAERNRYCFNVPQSRAITVLKKKSSWAVSWWKNRGFPKAGKCFGFAEDEAEIMSGVTRQQIQEVTEEMMGNPNR